GSAETSAGRPSVFAVRLGSAPLVAERRSLGMVRTAPHRVAVVVEVVAELARIEDGTSRGTLLLGLIHRILPTTIAHDYPTVILTGRGGVGRDEAALGGNVATVVAMRLIGDLLRTRDRTQVKDPT